MRPYPFLMLALIAAPALAQAPMAGDRSRYNACLAQVKLDPGRAIAMAQGWRVEGGGVMARHCLALAHAARNQWDEALKDYEGAATMSESARDGQALALWQQAGEAAMLAGQPEPAVRYLTRALGTPGGVEASAKVQASLRVSRAEALVDLKRNSEAAADLDAATRLDPDVRYGWLLKATLARRMSDLKTAEAAILEAGKREPDSADVQLEAGNIAAAGGNDKLAREAWLAAAQADPDGPAGKAAQAALQGD